MTFNVFLTVKKDDEKSVRRHGIETPTGTIVHHETRDYLIVKVPGHNYWSGRGQQSYGTAEFIVYKKEEMTGENEFERDFKCSTVIGFPIRKKAKA